MTPVELIGWWCAAIGAVGVAPQTVKLLRDRNTAGISLTFWQMLLSVGIAWGHHGIKIGQVNMLVPNAIMVATAIPTLWLICSIRGLNRPRVFLPPVVAAATFITIDLTLGSAPYGVVMAVISLLGTSGQAIDLVRSPDVSGVSLGFLVLSVVVQVSWETWGILVGDISTMINSGTLTAICTFMLVWYLLRRVGLRAFFPAPVAVPTREVAMEEGQQTAAT